MKDKNKNNSERAAKKFHFSFLQVIGIVVLVMIVMALLTAWWVKHYIYASKFTPTVLTAKEQKVLDSKLVKLEESTKKESDNSKKKRPDKEPPLETEIYSEEGAKREISFTEKELNALIAKNPKVAQRVAIDLSDNLINIEMIVPMDEEIPFLGGKTLRLNLGITLAYKLGKPVLALKGVSVGRIPIPNAWLGNLKNRNLIKEFGDQGGFWKLFSDGVADLKVREGHIQIKLKD
jgi:hypothetical protein